MHKLNDLCYMLEDEIGRITQKGDISPAELENVYKSVKTIYYIKVIKAMEEFGTDERGYSGKRMTVSYDGHPYFDMENSYGGYSTRRDSMGRYSREGDSKEEMRKHLEMAMNMATSEQERQNLREMLNNL